MFERNFSLEFPGELFGDLTTDPVLTKAGIDKDKDPDQKNE